MKKRQKLIIVMLFAVVLALTPMSVAWGDTSSGEMTATGQQNVATDGGQRINKFKLDGKFNYQSLGNDPGKPTYTLNASSIQDIVKNKLLPQWSGVAAGVFRDQAGQLVDLYGYENNGGCMTKSGFDAYFDMSRSGNDKYKDETWSCYSLRNKLAQTYPSRAGEQNWDQFVVSGVKQFSSLSGARRMMAQSIHDIEKNLSISTDDVLNAQENGEDRLSSMDDDSATTGFANIVTAINCKGSSKEYDYVTFGIAFYDFEPVPVAAEGLTYQSGKVWKKEDQKGANSSKVINGQQQDIMHSALLGDSVTETTSTTLSALASCKLTQNIGANISCSETETSSETNFWADPTYGAGSSTESSSSTMSMGMNWGAAWEMAGALGAEKGHSESKEVSKSSETMVSLPPHTVTNVNQKTTTTTHFQNYQQPVILSYKVALFAMSGDVSGAGAGGIYDDNLYDKQSLVIMFDTQDEDSTSYGCAATDDLYSRVVTNRSIKDYDSQRGRTFESHSTASRFNKSNGINWNGLYCYGTDVNALATTNYFYETLGKLSVEQDKTSSTAGEIYPLYDLASVRTPKTSFALDSRDGNNTLKLSSLPLEGYNNRGVAFYGFKSSWGEWKRCDANGTILSGETLAGQFSGSDAVVIKDDGSLAPNTNKSGTIYLTWKFKEGNPITDQSPEGQTLVESRIETPIVTINVSNSRFDSPVVEVGGSYTGYYRNPINLRHELTYEVYDEFRDVIETQVYWSSSEPSSRGIVVNENTGDVQFTQPGTYHVRPYVYNNKGNKVYPKNKDGDYVFATVIATKYDLKHFKQQAPTCENYGCTEFYWCSDGLFFSDAAGTNEISMDDCLIKPTGHDWGEWTTTKKVSNTEKGEQTRVCKNDKNHVQTRELYSVQFNMNGHGTAPKNQTVAQGASVKVPQDPTATGYTFGGWFEDENCQNAYDFGTTVKSVTGNKLVLYAKWTADKYTAAAMAIGDVSEDENGEYNVSSDVHGSITISDGIVLTEDGYTYCYKEVVYGAPVTLTVTPDEGYGLKEIMAFPVNPDSSVGEPFTPNKIGDYTYSFTAPAADVAVLCNFARVTVTYDGNAPEGKEAKNVPKPETIPCGDIPKKLGNEPSVDGYNFGGWFTDEDCTKPYLSKTALTEDTTLYAKWKKGPTYTVTYTLSWDPEPGDDNDPGKYSDSYQAEKDSKAYDPTNDLYVLAGKELRAAYELESNDGTCWFTDESRSQPYDFNTPITGDIHLYAKVVTRKYTVTYYNGNTSLGVQSVPYNTAIGQIKQEIPEPTKENRTFKGTWATEDGVPWDIATNPVTSDLNLYAIWPNERKVIFDANGGSGKIVAANSGSERMNVKVIDEGEKYSLPENTFTAPEEKCGPKTWEVKIGSGKTESMEPGESITVTDDTTVKAIWKDHKWGQWKETAPATIGSDGVETRVCAEDKTHVETRSIDKVDPTPLNNAIKAAEDTKKDVKVSEDGKDIDPADKYTTSAEKKALDDAITAAQNVVSNNETTQKQADDAVAAVKKAKETYDAAKKNGTKQSETSGGGGGGGGAGIDPVAEFIKMVNDLPVPADVKTDDETAVKAARDAYVKLTEEEKADTRITKEIMDKLAADEKAVEGAKKAGAVIALFNKLPVDPSKADPAEARAAIDAFNALTDAQKAKIDEQTMIKITGYMYYFAKQDAMAGKVTLKTVKAKHGRKAIAKWETNAVGTSGFQLVYSTSKKFTKKTTKKVSINSPTTLKKTVKKLKAGKRYYFKVRTFTDIHNPVTGFDEKVYGKWSNRKIVKARK